MLLVGVKRNGAVADVAVRVVAERDEPDAAAARLAGGEESLGERDAVAADAIEVLACEAQPVDGGRPVETRLAVAAVARRARLALAPDRLAKLCRRSDVDDEVGRAGERLSRSTLADPGWMYGSTVNSGSRGPSGGAGAAKRPSPIGLRANTVSPPADRRKSRRLSMRTSVDSRPQRGVTTL